MLFYNKGNKQKTKKLKIKRTNSKECQQNLNLKWTRN